MKTFDVLLYGVDKLCLVLLNSTTDLRSDEESIELREDSEHFVCIARRSKPVSQSRNDLVLNSSNAFVVCILSSDPDFATLCVKNLVNMDKGIKLKRNLPVETSRTSIRFITSYASFTSSSMSIPPTSIPTALNPFVGPVMTANCSCCFASPLDTYTYPVTWHGRVQS